MGLYNLKAGVAQIDELAYGGGLWRGLTMGQAWFVDPANGNDSNTGDSPGDAFQNLAAAHSACTDGVNDTVFFIGGGTSSQPTASITWSKSFTHLIGLSSNLPGVGQRCRVVGTADNDLTPVITISGSGCIFRNIQFYNGKDANSDSGCVLVTGDRNEFCNVFFAGMAHATPAARAGSYSLTLNGSHENLFLDCSIGLDTIIRAAANAELVLTGGSSKNTFRRVKFMSFSQTAGKFLVSLDTDVPSGLNSFEECLFYNNSTNWGTQITDAFTVIGAGATYYIDLYRCRLVGPSSWSDTVTHIYSSDPQPNAGFGVATNPTA